MKNPTILIVGKTGKTGARVNQRLQDQGYVTRAVSRSTTPSFDWDNPTSWAPAIKGTRSVYLTYQPDLAVPQAETAIKQFIDVAKENGVEHVVLLSGRGEDGAQRAEKVLQNSGIDWNVVRCSWFAQNFSESFMLEGILAGNLVLPAADTVEPFVDADDIADVAVAALTKPSLRNKVFELTGPRALTLAQCMEEISQALGRTVKYTPVAIDDFIELLRQQNTPEDLQWLFRELFTVVFDGRNSKVMRKKGNAITPKSQSFWVYYGSLPSAAA